MAGQRSTSRGARAYKLDCADARAAQAFDEGARARLLDHAPAAPFLQRLLTRTTRTRGPQAEALRLLSRRYPEADAEPFIEKANVCYWTMVNRHEPMIQQQSFVIQRTIAFDSEISDIQTIVKIGWYNAAVRFEPSRGTRFTTMAGRWAWARVQRERGKPGGIKSSRVFASVASIEEVHEDGTSILDTLKSEDGDLIGILERQQAKAILKEEIAKLGERDQALIAAWLASGQTGEVVAQFNISRARMWQIIHGVVDSVRLRMKGG